MLVLFSIHFFCGQPRKINQILSFSRGCSKPLHELLCFNVNQIGSAWCQTIGNWGQKTRISSYFKEILIKTSKVFLTKSVINRRISWQLPYRPVFGGNLVTCPEIQKFFKRCETQWYDKFKFSKNANFYANLDMIFFSLSSPPQKFVRQINFSSVF